jgi:endonuclease/exonuclease/phosphatase family metal-dependent hydrolase
MTISLKKIIYILSISIAIPVTAQTVFPIRVMTYNLRFGELASLESLAAYIRKINPDIVALQEVDCKTNRQLAPQQNGKDFITTLAFYTGLFGIYGKTIDFSDGYYGIGILSKYPIIAYDRVMLPNPEPRSEDRALLISTLDLPNNRKLIFACTHLDLTSDKRAVEMSTIKEYFQKNDSIHILAGDFNTSPSMGEVVKYLTNWKDALPVDFTFPTKNPQEKIDYILYDNFQKVKVVDAFVDKTSKLSDHLPGIANFEISF